MIQDILKANEKQTKGHLDSSRTGANLAAVLWSSGVRQARGKRATVAWRGMAWRGE